MFEARICGRDLWPENLNANRNASTIKKSVTTSRWIALLVVHANRQTYVHLHLCVGMAYIYCPCKVDACNGEGDRLMCFNLWQEWRVQGGIELSHMSLVSSAAVE